MELTPEQFEEILGRVVTDRLEDSLQDVGQKIDNLTTSVDKVVKIFSDHLNEEWPVHIHQVHSNIEKRVKVIEGKLKIKTI